MCGTCNGTNKIVVLWITHKLAVLPIFWSLLHTLHNTWKYAQCSSYGWPAMWAITCHL